MPDFDAAEAYETAMLELERRLPDLHAQVLDEVQRGREVNASEIYRNDMDYRDRQLTGQQLAKLSEADLATVDLSPEERLQVLARALAVATDTHNGSSALLSRFARDQGADGIAFEAPGDEGLREFADSDDDGQQTGAAARSRRAYFTFGRDDSPVTREPIEMALAAIEGDVGYN